MPNWCENTLQIKGPITDLEDMVNKLDQVKANALLEVFAPIGDWDYDKATKSWGTKWDVEYNVSDAMDAEDGQAILVMGFASAWGPPVEGIQTWSKLYPDTMFRIAYSESGMCFWGVEIIQDGEIISSNTGDIPDFLPFERQGGPTDDDYEKAWDLQEAWVDTTLQQGAFT
jgi:hypothetical protein